MSQPKNDQPQDEKSKPDRPKPQEPIMIVNGRRITFVRGRDEIEESGDEAAKAIFEEAWDYFAQLETRLEQGEIEDPKGLLAEGLRRIRAGRCDFRIDTTRKWRFSSTVFNALPALYMNPTIARESDGANEESIQKFVIFVAEHDQAFWNRMAMLMID